MQSPICMVAEKKSSTTIQTASQSIVSLLRLITILAFHVTFNIKI